MPESADARLARRAQLLRGGASNPDDTDSGGSPEDIAERVWRRQTGQAAYTSETPEVREDPSTYPQVR